jgi:hypothetical protein
VSHSEALGVRCAASTLHRQIDLARIPGDLLCATNRQFAGVDCAEADRRRAASPPPRRPNAEGSAARAARAAKQARPQQAVLKRAPKISPVKPVPILDPGFESLAESKKNLSRAEACLLLASALRMSPTRHSALERAAAKVAGSG